MTVPSFIVANLTALRAIDMTEVKVSRAGIFFNVVSNLSQYTWSAVLAPAGENWGDTIIIPSSRPNSLGAFVKNPRAYASAGTPNASPPVDFIFHIDSTLSAVSLSYDGVWIPLGGS